jgi:uncharacterized protein (TIGR02147 family)
MSESIPISIFDYLEYRDFLREHYQYCKEHFGFYSYRYISRKTGIDASFYVKVLQKQLHIADKSITILADFLSFKKRERQYFEALVKFNKARQKEQMKTLFEKLIALKDPVAKTLDGKKYSFFSDWHNIAIKELLNFYKFKGDYKELSELLIPAISETQAKKSIELLLGLGLVELRSDGYYQLTEQFLTTGEVLKSLIISHFQKEMSRLGMEAFDRIPREDRDISTVTVSTSKECLEMIRERIAEMRKEILEMVKREETVDGVYQMNFQIFPLTKTVKKKEQA